MPNPPVKLSNLMLICWVNRKEDPSAVHIISAIGAGRCACGQYVITPGHGHAFLNPTHWPRGMCKACLDKSPAFVLEHLGMHRTEEEPDKSDT